MLEKSVSTFAIDRFNRIKWFVHMNKPRLAQNAALVSQLKDLSSLMYDYAALVKRIEDALDKTETLLRNSNSDWEAFVGIMDSLDEQWNKFD